MITKRSWIVLLGGLNALLAGLLVGGLVKLPRASAQFSARPGDYVTVTAKPASRNYDVLYLLDVPSRRLHAFRPESRQSHTLIPIPPRDLELDFGR